METIDIKEMLNYFKGKIPIIVAMVTFIGIVGAIYSLFMQTPMYRSTTSVILKNDSTQGNNLTFNDLNMNKNLVGTYSEIVKSKRTLNQVIENLKLDYSAGELSGMINVSSVNDTEIIKITVTNINSKNAKVIADEVANVFVEEIPDLYSISNVSILDTAEVANSPYNISIKKQAILYLLIGLVLGCGIVFVMYYFDRTIKSVVQVETKIGLPILGVVQEYKRGNK